MNATSGNAWKGRFQQAFLVALKRAVHLLWNTAVENIRFCCVMIFNSFILGGRQLFSWQVEWSFIMQWFCMISQNQRFSLYRRLQTNFRLLQSFPISSVTAGIPVLLSWKAFWKKDFIPLEHCAQTVKLALDTYQIRSQKGIERYWLIMSFTHYLCCICKGGYCSFEEGYQYLAQSVAIEHLEQLYKLSKSCSSFEAFS